MNGLWRSTFKPPFKDLPWVIFGYVIVSIMLMSEGGVFTGHLLGYDDQVRMVQVLEWINGNGWYDRTITRVNPPDGFTTIWSRLVDIPLAAVIIAAQQVVSQKTAALIAATIIPMAQLAILFAVLPYFARPLVGKDYARASVAFIIFSSILNIKLFSLSGFFVGQASHHSWYIILVLCMFGAAARIAMGSTNKSPVFFLSASLALLQAIGIEGFPLIAGTAAILALVSWRYATPAIAARAGNAFLLGALGGIILLPSHQPPDKFLTVSFAEPSILGPILVFAAGAMLKIQQLVLSFIKSKSVSAALLSFAAIAAGIGLVHAFPDILNGPAAALSPSERIMAAYNHTEAQSLAVVSDNLMDFISNAAPICITIAAGLFAFITTKRRANTLAFTYLGFLLISTGMSFLFSRYYHHAMTVSSALAVWAWLRIKDNLPYDRNYSLQSLAAFLMLGPLWTFILPGIVHNKHITSEMIFFPAVMQTTIDHCDSLPVANFINAHYNKDTLLLVYDYFSQPFLYQTHVKIDFLANYPSQDRFIDNFMFFRTPDPRRAAEIVQSHGVDLISICKTAPTFDPKAPANNRPFIWALQAGEGSEWLKKIDIRPIDNFVLYEVDKAALARALE